MKHETGTCEPCFTKMWVCIFTCIYPQTSNFCAGHLLISTGQCRNVVESVESFLFCFFIMNTLFTSGTLQWFLPWHRMTINLPSLMIYSRTWTLEVIRTSTSPEKVSKLSPWGCFIASTNSTHKADALTSSSDTESTPCSLFAHMNSIK